MSALWDVLMSADVVTGHNLKQITCTIREERYWAEHIGGESYRKVQFGHIEMNKNATLMTEDGDGEESEEEEDEEDFAM